MRDPDVFDTWFSSWLMPLSVLGWPEKTPDFARYYPTSVLVTGFDIIFFWVARMIMAGTTFDGRAPFADVVLHGLVRDEKGQKMSKTKGNVVDPLEMCDEFGADAVRFTLAVLSGTGRDLPFGKTRVAGYRAFATKVWNAARFALQMLEDGAAVPPDALDFASLGTVDRWILARLSEATAKVNAALESYRFDEAANALYQFFWSDFCDGYVEMVKPVLRGADVPEGEKEKTRGVLKRVLLDSLALLHPFMPFVSCEIREALHGDGLRPHHGEIPRAAARVEGRRGGRGDRHAARGRDENPESPRGKRPRTDRGARDRPRAAGRTPFKGNAASRSAPHPSRAPQARGDFFEGGHRRERFRDVVAGARAGRGSSEEGNFSRRQREDSTRDRASCRSRRRRRSGHGSPTRAFSRGRRRPWSRRRSSSSRNSPSVTSGSPETSWRRRGA